MFGAPQHRAMRTLARRARPGHVGTRRPHRPPKRRAKPVLTSPLARAPPRGAAGAIVGTEAFVHITDPAAAKAVLLSESAVRKRPLYNAFKAYAGEGVFTADGKDWCARARWRCEPPRAEHASSGSEPGDKAASFFPQLGLTGCAGPWGLPAGARSAWPSAGPSPPWAWRPSRRS